ncbi:MAG: O-methyltransferase [Nitrospirales bacterium]|nr:MAG: O-methyltransferase [Nitrospirales bacterium]
MAEQKPVWMQSEETSELTAIPLLQILSGIYASKTLAAAVEFDLFTKIAETGGTFEEVAAILELELRPVEMLMSGCAALGLLERREGRFYNSALSDTYLIAGKPDYFGPMILMADRRVYEPWLHLTEALKTNRALTWGSQPGLFEALSSNPDEQRMFTRAMHAVSLRSGTSMAKALDLSNYRCLMDVGGGSGAYCIEAVRHCPTLRAVVFDLSSALEVARQNIKEAGFSDRIETIPGDFFLEALPKGSDLILLSMILHDWSPGKNLTILRKCMDALEPSGSIIISELMMDDDKTGPLPAAMMSLCMLIDTEGRNYTWSEYTAWLEEVGFTDVRRIPIHSPGANGLLVGRKP